MTARSRPAWAAALGLLGVALLGCSQGDEDRAARTPRPTAGDRVTPEVVLTRPWKAGENCLFGIRFNVRGPAEPGARLLAARDVPEGAMPQVAVTFYRGEEELPRVEPHRLERCC